MIEPMLAQLTHSPLEIKGTWLLEPKYDGERIIAESHRGKISLWTRRHVNASNKFPEVVEALKNIKNDDWILDGEITVKGGFRQLLKRNVEDPLKIKILSQKIPAKYNVFDILKRNGKDILNKPLIERKAELIRILPAHPRLELVPFHEVQKSTIEQIFEDRVREGYEGIILKDAYSHYDSGKRPGTWLKLKREDTIDVNIIGATKSQSSLPFGALIMERNDKYFGKVGTGFSEQEQREILNILKEHCAPLQIEVPEKLKKQILITSKPLTAEIRVNEIYKESPRAPVWVRFRWQ
ncbi:ATP-dependent DNA ligase [Methanobacterium aggregans]|uniref:ATP-dependent DNA ligase n=1 Tax=Methanobacterium aggregans TaxID=1615586 RepID=UPI001AE4007E|nr:ATP-dependent DNA ligase [Methanobacterium aggregans]MBP2045120.1 DNA ligase-1 [Methanobacterium aggregans]